MKAEAVKLSDDSKGIGFRVNSSDWAGLSGEEYQIVSVKDASVKKNYQTIQYSSGDAGMMTGGELLKDYSKNPVAQSGQVLDVSAVSPDCRNHLDTKGSVAVIEEGVHSEPLDNGAGAYYRVPLSIRDGSDGVQAVGVAGQMGQISITSYANAPQMTYEYEISNNLQKPDKWTGKGTIGGERNEIWSSFPATGDGTYYLHLKVMDIEDKELDDTKGLTLKLQLKDILSNTSEVSLQWKDLALDKVGSQLTLTQKSINV